MNKKAFYKSMIDISSQKDKVIFTPLGLWVSGTAIDAEQTCKNLLQKNYPKKIIFDLEKLKDFDTSGVWLLQRTISAFKNTGYHVEIQNANESFSDLASLLEGYKPSLKNVPTRHSFFEDRIVHLGMATLEVINLIINLIIFLGEIATQAFKVILNPRRLRIISVVSHIEKFGVNALPIVSVIAVALGLVLAYQGEEQLRRFGAEIYTINLVSISVVREVGILITAILVAGRTGSAITAEIGIMKINQEVDALNTLGLNPMEILIIPRIFALVLVMPLLAFVSDIMGLLGGGIMVMISLDVSPQLYIYRIGEAITMGSFWVGIMKAPFFGAIIGIVACFEGMRVEGTAESIGICTTRSVVEGIFLVTIADALLSIFFLKIGI